MGSNRLEAFSDGVMAIIITIMVLELRAPHEPVLTALVPLAPVFASYLLSFAYIAIYWNNHHHLMNTVQRVSGPILWANMGLLFTLSLVPFVTAWMGENHVEHAPTAVYGAVMVLSNIAWLVLQWAIISAHGSASVLKRAVGRDWKGKLSFGLYAASIPLAFVEPWLSQAIFVLVAAMWLVPDRRIEREVSHGTE
jgi:uncharacterized membrane protein